MLNDSFSKESGSTTIVSAGESNGLTSYAERKPSPSPGTGSRGITVNGITRSGADGSSTSVLCVSGLVTASLFFFGSLFKRYPAAGLALWVLLCSVCVPARADVGVVLNESLDTSVARLTGSGHAAVYFSRICAESPVALRLCGPGEQGSVMSNYTTLREDQPFEWNIVPLSVYLYGVEDPRDRPLFGSPEIKHVLEERYREKFLTAYCWGPPCTTSGGAEWREMVGAGLFRSIYIFAVETTLEQDLALIEEFNAQPNINHFNPITRNCANFTKSVLDRFFPGAAHRDWINDFGMTSPKAVARSFTHFANHHPELHLHVMHFAQEPGTIKRSSECRDGTEQLYHSKKLLVPMAIFAPHELGGFAVAYLLTGRFNPEHEWEKHPALEIDGFFGETSAGHGAPRVCWDR